MLLICYNSCIKSWWNKKRSKKNNKIKPFTNKYNWEGINVLSEKDSWKKIDKNNQTIALNVLYARTQIVKNKSFF